ncbi:MAG: hypothetical protein ACUZ8N_10185 [Candidatus Scalindua sp.]
MLTFSSILTPSSLVDNIQESQPVPEKLEKENNNNMYRNIYIIIGIIDGHYIVQTPKGLKKVKVIKSNKKNVRDEIKIENL